MTLPSWLVEQMEADLRKSEETFGVIVQESLDVILIVDRETDEILQVNEAAESILGYRRDQLLGQTFASICAPSFDEETLDLLLEFADTATVFESRKFLRADGSTCPMDVTATRIPWEDAQMTLVTLRDVTDREAAERKLRRHREQLEHLVEQRTAALKARNEELDAFAHTVAHDLKSPLTRLIGASTILRRSYDNLSKEKRFYYLEAIETVSYQMSSIVEALLLMANVRSLDAVTLVPLNMKVIVESVEERLLHLIEKHDVEIIKPRQWPQAIGYAPWVQEIWANYLSNAIKYGGTPPRVELGYQIEDGANRVRFWVRDNGVGLKDEQIAKLFLPFSRIEQARAEGNGLGLSIVRRIVEKLGGNVEVESVIGEGSTFSFSLPAIKHVQDSQYR
jgi:PAS domain S-box-containing protein